MELYLAPMEGVTGYIYRNAYWRHFPDVDKVYAPFLQPNQKRVLAPKEERDILPENNPGIPLVPQVLTCSADGFKRAVHALEAYGYQEVNLNLGCPSGTVVSKGKGAGMLVDHEKLRQFFETVFSETYQARISVKTRLGMTPEEDYQELLQIFAAFPISELIVHPRYRSDFYKGQTRQSAFEETLHLGHKVCYNGNIFTKEDYQSVMERYRQEDALTSIMLGRGLLANPALARVLKGETELTAAELRVLHDDVMNSYREHEFGERNTLFKMKELWNYWGTIFEDADRELKQIRKATHYRDYQVAVGRLFQTKRLTPEVGYQPPCA